MIFPQMTRINADIRIWLFNKLNLLWLAQQDDGYFNLKSLRLIRAICAIRGRGFLNNDRKFPGHDERRCLINSRRALFSLSAIKTQERYCLNFQNFGLKAFIPVFLFSILILPASTTAQRSSSKSGVAASRRISFAEAQKLLVGETEGNLANQPNKFSRTKLSDGRVLEVFYPITTRNPSRKGQTITVPGYGVIYASKDVFDDTNRPRHALEDLIPDGRHFVASVPMLVMKLEKRLGKLDYTRGSLRRLDSFIANYHSSHTTAQTEQQVFQQVTAYYGEVLRRELKGEWKVREEKVTRIRVQAEPNIVFVSGGVAKEIKPWTSILTVMSNEDLRGVKLSKIFDNDLASAR